MAFLAALVTARADERAYCAIHQQHPDPVCGLVRVGKFVRIGTVPWGLHFDEAYKRVTHGDRA